MTDLNDPIQGADAGVAQPTPDAASGVEKSTPAQNPPSDVDKLKADYEARLSKYETDLNQMKSTFQSREAKVTKEWQDRYNTLQKQMHETAMKGMTDEERARYERQLETEEFQNLRSRLAEIEQEKEMLASTASARDWFLEQGVPANLLKTSEGYDALVNAGWSYLTSELSRLREIAKNPQPDKNANPPELKQAPDVITDKATPGGGTTWATLVKQWGSMENVFRAVEEGNLDPSVLPQD